MNNTIWTIYNIKLIIFALLLILIFLKTTKYAIWPTINGAEIISINQGTSASISIAVPWTVPATISSKISWYKKGKWIKLNPENITSKTILFSSKFRISTPLYTPVLLLRNVSF